jgi:hypothetical protein
VDAICTHIFTLLFVLKVLKNSKYLLLAAETEAILVLRNFADIIVFVDLLVFQFHQKTPLLIERVLDDFFLYKVVLLGDVIWMYEAKVIKACAENRAIEKDVA